MKIPRMSLWLFIAAALLAAIAWAAPQNIPVVGYKLALATSGAVLGYWIDRGIFPYARPDKIEPDAGQVAQIRRALVVSAVVIGITLGL